MNRHHMLNFNRLGKYLISLPDDYKHFDMEHYFHGDVYNLSKCFNFTKWSVEHVPSNTIVKQGLTDPIVAGQCGTVACALGHGPVLGDNLQSNPGETWVEYSLRVFGIVNSAETKNIWNWVFGSDWGLDISYDHTQYLKDTTPRGAGLRALWVAHHGLKLPKFMQDCLDSLQLQMHRVFVQGGEAFNDDLLDDLQQQYDDWKVEWAETILEMVE